VPAIDDAPDGGAKRSPCSIWGGRPETLFRFGLVPVFVLICYAFPWRIWRASITAALITVLQEPSNPVIQLTFDTFSYDRGTFQVGISCTALDVFFGSIPLLWQRKRPLGQTLGFFALYFLVLSTINFIRLILGFRLYATGASWFAAHELMSGVFYFVIFVWIVRYRRRPSPEWATGRSIIRDI